MLLWGDDLAYVNATMPYTNAENTMQYMNEKYEDLKLSYSTPS